MIYLTRAPVFFAFLLFISWKMRSFCLLTSRSTDTISQACSKTLRLQRLDVFKGDSVQLPCTCRSATATRKRSKVSQIVTDGSDYMDISMWSYAKQLSIPMKYHVFSINRNKDQRCLCRYAACGYATSDDNVCAAGLCGTQEWVELISRAQDAVGTESGNSASADCVFPFYYHDNISGRQVTAYTCSESGRDDITCWCSTTTNYTRDRKWGFCPCAAPKRGIWLVAELGTDPGSYCRFPFKYKGSEYFQCIYEGRDRCWCGTTYDVDRDNKWGFCPCSTSSIPGAWEGWQQWKSCSCGETTTRVRQCLPLHRNIPTGRKVVCNGFAIQIKLCSCVNELDPTLQYEIEDIKGRSNVVLPDRRNPVSQIVITNLTSADSGWYQCVKGELKRRGPRSINDADVVPVIVYQLNVINFDEVQMILLDDGNKIPYDTGLYGSDRLVWFWTEWQKCDRCGVLTGEQKRFGFCYTYEPAGHGVAAHISPCRSSLLSETKQLRLQRYTDYLVVKTCKAKCHKSKEKYKLVKIDKKVEMPTRRPPAYRAVYHATKGQTMHLKCPKAYPLLPVTWQFEEKTLHGEIDLLLRHQKRGKSLNHDGIIGVDDQLLIHKITESSIGYFSCFVNRTLTASYSIDVKERIVQRLDRLLDTVIYFILAFVVFVFCSIAYNVFKIESKAVAY